MSFAAEDEELRVCFSYGIQQDSCWSPKTNDDSLQNVGWDMHGDDFRDLPSRT